jgi:hypothetical protein
LLAEIFCAIGLTGIAGLAGAFVALDFLAAPFVFGAPATAVVFVIFEPPWPFGPPATVVFDPGCAVGDLGAGPFGECPFGPAITGVVNNAIIRTAAERLFRFIGDLRRWEGKPYATCLI